MKRRSVAARFGVLASVLTVLYGGAAIAQTQRPFTVDDLFELESIGRYYGGPYAWSADGSKLAFTKVRAKKTLGNHKWEYLWGNAGGEIYLQTGPGEPPVRITDGITDGSGWWSPQWSPDAKKLGMLSTRGGNVRVWVYDLATRQVTQVSPRGVATGRLHERPYLWVDNTHILFPSTPGGEPPHGMTIELQTPRIATQEWPKVERGIEPTASALESGVEVDLSARPQGDLMVVDVASGAERVIAHGNSRSWQLAPDGKTVAFTREVSIYLPKADVRLPFGSTGVSTLELARLDGTPLTLAGEISKDVLDDSVRWSPDGTQLVFFGYAGARDQPPLLYTVDVTQRKVSTRALPSLNVAPSIRESAQVEWTGSGGLMIFAAPASSEAQPEVTARRDWWLLQGEAEPRQLTASIKNPPRSLWPQPGRRAFFGVADDELWQIEPASGVVTRVTAAFEPKVQALSWPAATNNGVDQYRIPGRTYSHAIFSVQKERHLESYLVDLESGTITPVAKPAAAADLMAYEPQTGTAVFSSSDRNGLRVWSSDVRSGQPFELVRANEFLRDIAEGEFRQIDYTSLNGEPLKAWLLLPVGYEEGRRYPLLTWVYAGSVQRDRPPTYLGTINSGISLNMQIPAAKGYAVLFPSMPLNKEGLTDDPMLRLTEGVLPAVDQAIAEGIADPGRLYVMGQSFGGFSTYGLVTQTKRFHAAVSLAGLSNLISLYGTFGARERYTDFPHENLFVSSLFESAQVAMGVPPWKDLGRYIRNSPIFFVDRVETPIMMVYGDMDYVAMQQGEEFFSALYRQGKRASFVRYWGEGHVLESPANIRDMWQRVFAWLEQFPRATTGGADGR